MKNLICVLKCFQDASGLAVNLTKSCIYGVGVDPNEVEMFARILNCNVGSFPFIYLGLPVRKNMHKSEAWGEVKSRMTNRLSAWKSKVLSIGGRLVLTKVVLGSLPLYYFSLFQAPINVIDSLERIRNRFFWGFKEGEKGMVWISWKKAIASRDLGGLGISSLRAKNLSLLGKWRWRFLKEKGALWRKVIQNIFGNDGGFSSLAGPGNRKGVWRNILSSGAAIDALGIPFRNSFSRKVISGVDTLFWKDIWLDDGSCLMAKFPRLYALDSNPNCHFFDRWVLKEDDWRGCWSWRVQPRGRSVGELHSLLSLINGLSLKTGVSDDWKWTLNSNDGFSVNCLSKLIDHQLHSSPILSLSPTWNSWVPRKVNIFNWRVYNDGIPHLSNLDKRGIDVHSLLCPLCDLEVEDTNHVLFSCSKVKVLWVKCFDWWGLVIPLTVQTAIDLSSSFPINFGNKWVVQAFHGVRLVTLWVVWRWRNRVVHALSDKKESIRNEDIFSQIQVLSLLWISNRCPRLGFNWSTWVSNPRGIVDRGG
ncbi:putative RNA-directed DNA polymerase [Tanacetum coccineum]